MRTTVGKKAVGLNFGDTALIDVNQALHVKHMDHVTIVVSNLEATENFYCGCLGMDRVERPAFPFDGRWFQAGTTQVHATISHSEAGQAGWGDRGTTQASRGHHFAFQVEDARAAAEAARQLGIEIADGPKLRPDGYVQLYLYDPDRHVVELFSNPEA